MCGLEYPSKSPYVSKYCSSCKPVALKNNQQRFHARHPERSKQYAKEIRKKRKESGKTAATWLLYKYGLTAEDTKRLYAEYPVCAICNAECDLVVDHCHKTGEVRGRLCRKCNLALGNFKDSVLLLESALEYLEKCGLDVSIIEVV